MAAPPVCQTQAQKEHVAFWAQKFDGPNSNSLIPAISGATGVVPHVPGSPLSRNCFPRQRRGSSAAAPRTAPIDQLFSTLATWNFAEPASMATNWDSLTLRHVECRSKNLERTRSTPSTRKLGSSAAAPRAAAIDQLFSMTATWNFAFQMHKV